uniref:Immunoglobulin domain-containing protein n=1 Tax=Terrapene triunguis TaxID=2587831 RepID=A0A674K1A0_9SAUR
MRIPSTRELWLGVCGAGSPAHRAGILGGGNSGIWERISVRGPRISLTACLLCADPSLPRPSISLSPTGITAPGADVTIRCQGQRRNVTFFLHKAGDLNPQQHMDPAGDGAEFLIPTVGRQHGGSYSCSYRPRSEPFVSSQPSDTVQLVVAGEGYPKPNISLSPRGVSRGGAVTVRCWGQRRGMRFVLNKDGRHFQAVDSDRFEAVFSINMSREHSGNYSCSYHSRSEPFAMSYPSDPVELVLRGEGPGSASPLPMGTEGCSGFWSLGSFSRSSQESLGSWRGSSGWVFPQGPCLWDRAVRMGHSDGAGVCLTACLLLIVDLRYPKPSISLRPSGEVALGGAVTVRCWGRHQNMRFLLYKDGNPNFPIRNVSRRDAGSYSCYHHDKVYQFIWSHPSDPVELGVAGELPGSVSLLPAPHPAGPSGPGACARGQADTGPPPRISGARAQNSSGEQSQLLWLQGAHKVALDPAEETPGCGAGMESLVGSPARGSSSCWRFEAEGGGIPALGELQSRDLSQGDAPPAAPALGMHRGVRVQGLPSRPCPQPVPAFHGWLCDAHPGWGLSG